MSAAGVILLALAALIGYEAIRLLSGATVSASANGGSGASPTVGGSSVPPVPATGTPGNAAPNPSTDYATLAEAHSRITRIPAAVYLAIIANESSPDSRAHNALFGIQGTGVPYTDWHPLPGGGRQYYQSQLQSYPTADEAFSGFDRFVQVGRYAPAWAHLQSTGDWRGWLHMINQQNYAEDQSWWQAIIRRAGG